MPVSRLAPLIVFALLLPACSSTPGPDIDRPRGDPPGVRNDGGDGGARIREDLRTQLSEVEQRLGLTPRQQTLWDRYRETVGALMADQLRMDPRPTTRVDAVRQIGRKVDVVRNRLVAMEDIADAASRLYDALDAEQRKVADRLLPGTVPALYSGLAAQGSPAGERRDRRGPRPAPQD